MSKKDNVLVTATDIQADIQTTVSMERDPGFSDLMSLLSDLSYHC